MKRIAILGSTGSVGRQTLSVIEAAPDRFRVVALAAGRNVDGLADQVLRFRPELVSVADAAGADRLRARIGDICRIEVGDAGLLAVAEHPGDLVVAEIGRAHV